MTDLDIMTDIFDRAQIEWILEEKTEVAEAVKHLFIAKPPECAKSILVGDFCNGNTSGKTLKQKYDGGYSGFFTEFAFGVDGTLLAIWAWE